GIWISGGHNVVLIGCDINFTRTTGQTEGNGRVSCVSGNTGTVHLEGIYAHGPGLVEGSEGYNGAGDLQIENSRYDYLGDGGAAQIHSDLVEWGTGATGHLRVDHFSGGSKIQGLSAFKNNGSWDIRNVNVWGVAGGFDPSPVLAWIQPASAKLSN